PAFISAIFGVTEPSIYGITLPLKRPFIISCIASGIGGAIIALTGAALYSAGPLGVFKIPTFIHPEEGINGGFWGMMISIIVTFVLAFVLTLYFGGVNRKEDEEQVVGEESKQEDKVEQNINNEVITCPLTGDVKNLSSISDSAFSSGALGKGVAINPTEGRLISPVSGTVSALFGTHHAIGIKTEHGAELLVHIGMDTVQLDGEHFKAHVSQGDQIEEGQLLIEFDIESIRKAGYEIITPVVITNSDQYNILETVEEGNIEIGKPIITLEK